MQIIQQQGEDDADVVLKCSVLDSVFPYWQDLVNATQCVRYADALSNDEPVQLPVDIQRFTHHTVNADLAFGEDHDNRQ